MSQPVPRQSLLRHIVVYIKQRFTAIKHLLLVARSDNPRYYVLCGSQARTGGRSVGKGGGWRVPERRLRVSCGAARHAWAAAPATMREPGII